MLFKFGRGLLILYLVAIAFTGLLAIAQSYATVPVNTSSATTTQLIAGAGGVSYPLTYVGLTTGSQAGTPGSIAFVTGTVDGETPGCSTGRASLTGALVFNQAGTGGAQMIVASSPIYVPTSSSLCIQTTNAAVIGGWVTRYR